MDPLPFLRPTSLQQMRGFLAESGARLEPWSGTDEVMDELVSLLSERRDDAAFFARLTPFLEELCQGAARGESGLPARDAELLSQATVESLVEELRARLRSAPRGAASKLLRALMGERSAALVSLAVLAAGVSGCTTSTPEPSNEPGTPGAVAPRETEARPQAGNEPGTAGPVQQNNAIKPPAPPANQDELNRLFKEKSAEEVAKALEKAVDASVPPAVPQDPDEAAPFRPLRLGGGGGHAKYKGVGF